VDRKTPSARRRSGAPWSRPTARGSAGWPSSTSGDGLFGSAREGLGPVW